MATRLVTDPIYQQLNKILRELIASEKYKVGDKFMTERMICELYNVSRVTANKALSSLVAEGLLQFKKGVGTFVRSKPKEDPSPSIASFTLNTKAAGMVPSSKVLEFQLVPAREVESEVLDVLELAPGEEVFRLQRLRFADDIPMVLERRYVRARFCPELQKEQAEGSLYDVFIQKYKLNFTGSEETIQAVTLGEEESKLLGVEQGKAAFLITAVGYIDNSTPLWFERTLYRPDGMAFRCQVRPYRHEKRLQERILLSPERKEPI
ncbi:MAG: GntR family transcriptional regulator [Spirochaetales bacterium]